MAEGVGQRRLRWTGGFLIFFLVILTAPLGHTKEKQNTALAQGQELFYAGSYEEALFILEELAARGDVSPEIRVAALKMVAFCYFLVAAKEQAKDAWLRLLAIDPAFKLDPVEESPDFVEFFNELGAPGKPPAVEEQKSLIPAATSAKKERGCGIVLCLIPAGVGQYANGKLIKGIVFSALEVAFLATNVGLWAANQGDVIGQHSDGRPIYRNLKTVRDRWAAQVVFFVLSVVTPIVGIVDAFVFWD